MSRPFAYVTKSGKVVEMTSLTIYAKVKASSYLRTVSRVHTPRAGATVDNPAYCKVLEMNKYHYRAQDQGRDTAGWGGTYDR